MGEGSPAKIDLSLTSLLEDLVYDYIRPLSQFLVLDCWFLFQPKLSCSRFIETPGLFCGTCQGLLGGFAPITGRVRQHDPPQGNPGEAPPDLSRDQHLFILESQGDDGS